MCPGLGIIIGGGRPRQRPQQLKGTEEGLEKRKHAARVRAHHQKSLGGLGLNFPTCEMGTRNPLQVPQRQGYGHSPFHLPDSARPRANHGDHRDK